MEKRSKRFAMAMLYVLAMAGASKAFSSANLRVLAGEDEGNWKSNEPAKVATSPSPISTPIQKLAISDHNHTPTQPPINPNHLDFSSGNSPSLIDNSTKLAPSENLSLGASRQSENDSSQSSPKKELKSAEVPMKEDDKPVQSSQNDPEKRGNLNTQAPPQDNVHGEGKEISNSGKTVDNIKNESCESPDTSNIACQNEVLVACVLKTEIDSTKFLLVIQNTGEDDLNVNIKSQGKIKIDFSSLNIPGHSSKKVNISAGSLSDLNITLVAGEHSDCLLLPKTPVSDRRHFDQFPDFSAVTPVRGAYFLFAAGVVIAGTWACCNFGKKRPAVGIPYCRLEMVGRSESASQAAGEAAPGDWDQNWDDAWDDDEEAVKRIKPSEQINGISSTSDKVTKDGWEIEWDD